MGMLRQTRCDVAIPSLGPEAVSRDLFLDIQLERNCRTSVIVYRQWLCVKHKERAGGNTRFPQKALHQKFGLVRLTARTRSFPWAKA